MSALPPLSSIPTEMIIDYMQKLFAIGDTNGDGVLSPTEFAEVRQQSRPLALRRVLRRQNPTSIARWGHTALGAQIRPLSACQGCRTLNCCPHRQPSGTVAVDSSEPRSFQLLSRSGFNFDSKTILKLVREADINQDGVIELDEFIPAMLGILAKAEDGTLDYDEPVTTACVA